MSPNNTTHTEHTALISCANTRQTHLIKQKPTWAASTSRYAHVSLPSIIPSGVRGPQTCNLQCRCFRLLQNVECPYDHHNHACFCMTGRPVALNIRVCPVPANHHRAIHCAVNPLSTSCFVPIPLACPSDTLFQDTGTGGTTMGAREACLRPISANLQPLSLALDARARVDYLTHASSPPALSALALRRAYTYTRPIQRTQFHPWLFMCSLYFAQSQAQPPVPKTLAKSGKSIRSTKPSVCGAPTVSTFYCSGSHVSHHRTCQVVLHYAHRPPS